VGANQVVKSTCNLCHTGCGILVHLVDGKAVKVEGDPDAPFNKGILCAKGLASLEYLYHLDRLKHPLKRVGERGGGKWKRISWDEALRTIANEFIRVRDNHGAESVAIITGASKGYQNSLAQRLANTFGTPNFVGQGSVCWVPKRNAYAITCGFLPFPDFEYPAACIVVWGLNPAETILPNYRKITQALDGGAKLIVIDARKIELAGKADFWVQLRPGSDLAFALGMINVIVNEDLFDKAFVDNWTAGFDRVKAHVQDYTPERVEEVTWVDAGEIREVARFYATNKPACIEVGNAVEHNVNSFQAHRAVAILKAITGNLGVPGGEMRWSTPPFVGRLSPQMLLPDKLPKDMHGKRISAGLKLIPPFASNAVPQSLVRAVLDQDPYPIRVAFLQGCNPLLTYSDAQETYQALKKLDFLAVAEMFMTPTAELADVVLPVASFLEFDSIVNAPVCPSIVQVQQKVAQVGECWSDSRIISELAKRLGLGEYFWDSDEEFLDYVLKPAGLTFNEFRKAGVISGVKQYRSHEANGFETPSGKVELYSSRLEEWGFDPLPTYYEPPETPLSQPELAKEYPLILASWKVAPFRHSGGRQITTLRGSHPEPVISIHPQTAGKLGIREGDWVYIETKRGRIRQKAALTDDIDPRVVGVDYGWWFPEKGASSLHGWAESNINILTDDKPPYNREMGTANLRGFLCKVYKAS
jgi:anaerobic selenocysteine-containing dehydrogenase